jgi:hypothetical protein
LFDCHYLFGLVVQCLVDCTKAARSELVEQGVLTGRVCTGNGVGFSQRLGGPGVELGGVRRRGMVEAYTGMAQLSETVAGRGHDGENQS